MQKIRFNLLANSQKFGYKINNTVAQIFHQIAYQEIIQMKSQVLKSFNSICIHGSYPEIMLSKLNQSSTGSQFYLHSHRFDNMLKQNSNVHIFDPNIPITSLKNNHTYDLIISCMETHHYDNNTLMQYYKSKLTPDGAVMGCCLAQNTFKELRWSYLLTENQRSGGISPKVLQFPGLGPLGHSITSSNLKMPTIVVKDLQLQFDSVVDLLSLLQIMGESGSLQGRRKGVYKDLLLASAAYYDSEFHSNIESKQKSVTASVQMGFFIAWKEHQNQPKPLTKGKVISNSFFSQIMKEDETAKIFSVSENSSVPKRLTLEEFNQIETKKFGDDTHTDQK